MNGFTSLQRRGTVIFIDNNQQVVRQFVRKSKSWITIQCEGEMIWELLQEVFDIVRISETNDPLGEYIKTDVQVSKKRKLNPFHKIPNSADEKEEQIIALTENTFDHEREWFLGYFNHISNQMRFGSLGFFCYAEIPNLNKLISHLKESESPDLEAIPNQVDGNDGTAEEMMPVVLDF